MDLALIALFLLALGNQITAIRKVHKIVEKRNEIDFDDLNPQAIGTRNAIAGKFPWMVSLHYKGKFHCSSFLITTKFLVTAAHCIMNGKRVNHPKDYKGYVGTIYEDRSGKVITFTKLILHAEPSLSKNDIALLKLSKPVRLSETVQTICLPVMDSTYEVRTAVLLGWPIHTYVGGNLNLSNILQSTKVTIATNAKCAQDYAITKVNITEKHICAGNDLDKGTCTFSSGGPLVIMSEIKPVAVGITSFALISRCPAVPIVFTAISKYVDWISKKMGDDAEDLCFSHQTVRKWDSYINDYV